MSARKTFVLATDGKSFKKSVNHQGDNWCGLQRDVPPAMQEEDRLKILMLLKGERNVI